jgi:hypothetical protein
MDFMIPVPIHLESKVDLTELLKDLGFVVDYKGEEGYIVFQHPEVILEFLVPEKGRGRKKPYDFPDLGINAQSLRFLDLLSKNTIRISLDGLWVIVPHPANYAIHKLIVSARRKEKAKSEKDRDQAVVLLYSLMDEGDELSIKTFFQSISQKMQRTVMSILSSLEEKRIIEILRD